MAFNDNYYQSKDICNNYNDEMKITYHEIIELNELQKNKTMTYIKTCSDTVAMSRFTRIRKMLPNRYKSITCQSMISFSIWYHDINTYSTVSITNYETVDTNLLNPSFYVYVLSMRGVYLSVSH